MTRHPCQPGLSGTMVAAASPWHQNCLLLRSGQRPVMGPGPPLARAPLPSAACTRLGFVWQEPPGSYAAVQAAACVLSSGHRDVGWLSWGTLWAAACRHRAGGELDAARAALASPQLWRATSHAVPGQLEAGQGCGTGSRAQPACLPACLPAAPGAGTFQNWLSWISLGWTD